MGVDTSILLPNNVRVRDVADVIGILVGKKAEKQYFNTSGSGWATHVEGVKVKPSSIPECADINIEGPFSDDVIPYRNGQVGLYVLYHFEPEYDGRLLYPRMSNFWVAVGKRLVQFFGGQVDYNDCDAVEINFRRRPKSRKMNAPSDGSSWYDFQERLLKLKPLTRDELERAFEE